MSKQKNIEMALDVDQSKNKRFCVVLRAHDSGRIASVGTVMELDGLTIDRNVQDSGIRRILVSARPVALAKIESIVNPPTSDRSFQSSREYLKAKVSIQEEMDLKPTKDTAELVSLILKDYKTILDLYKRGVGTDASPLRTLEQADSAVLEEWASENFATSESFWKTVDMWQILCNTVRDDYQRRLTAERNEFMVGAAIKQGGILNLPVREEHLTPQDRQTLQEMRDKSIVEYIERGMDPTLDFQVLIAAKDYRERLTFFAKMVRNECQRLPELMLEAMRRKRKEKMMKSQGTPSEGAWVDGRRQEDQENTPKFPLQDAWFDEKFWEDSEEERTEEARKKASSLFDDKLWQEKKGSPRKGAWFDDRYWQDEIEEKKEPKGAWFQEEDKAKAARRKAASLFDDKQGEGKSAWFDDRYWQDEKGKKKKEPPKDGAWFQEEDRTEAARKKASLFSDDKPLQEQEKGIANSDAWFDNTHWEEDEFPNKDTWCDDGEYWQ
mmetsp:Transcript_21861/g.50424  ORF Transcript_21861/g.50424 Transcript_21861/m.50424 type:complete len:495 (-) Transcript_21861:271-1755(-)